ncbi:MAG TPA: hypothetical protein VFY39_09490 [Gammaproteobacteria bacterium]|nr:hypothetical protein [Gammaproteobacteria bacterium]
MPEIEVAENLKLQRKHWRIERIGWCAILLIVLAEVLGAFGGGPFSTAMAVSPNGSLSAEYARLSRMTHPSLLQVRIDESAVRGGEVRLWLSRDYVDDMQVQQVTPQPKSIEIGTGRLTYMFDAAPTSGPLRITFALQAQRMGKIRGAAGLDSGRAGGTVIRFSQFIFP